METLDRLFWLFIRKCLFVELFGKTHFALFFSEFPTVQCPVDGANGVCFYNNLYNCGHKQNRLGFSVSTHTNPRARDVSLEGGNRYQDTHIERMRH